jgi:hypothetical protein
MDSGQINKLSWGLYNRVTYEIKLSPFTLKECEELYKDNGVSFSRLDK